MRSKLVKIKRSILVNFILTLSLNDKIYEDINKYVAYLIENHTDLEDTLIYIKEIWYYVKKKDS